MRTYAIYFLPHGSLSGEEIGSDTLFGAVCWAIEILKLKDISEMLKGFETHPLFAFSSAFPFWSYNGCLTRFYPNPLLPGLSPDQVNRLAEEEPKLKVIEKAKIIKKSAWVSEALFFEIVRGECDLEGLCHRLVHRGAHPRDVEKQGLFLMSYEERTRLQMFERLQPLKSCDVPRNQIDRVQGTTAEGLLFTDSQLFFARGAGLWCLMRAEGETVEALIRPAFRYLADTGIGGERTVGKGHFNIKIEEAPSPPDTGESANSLLTLSYYLPAGGELQLDLVGYAGYNLVHRWARRESKFPQASAGQTSPPVYKRLVRLFAPGSIFPLTERKEIYGRLALVVPDGEGPWPVWQSGLAIGAFAHISQENREKDERH
ncbi:MAG: CRISPR type III-associated RAMP protein Csm4 [Syntrophomonadaceae bacterium]|nr:CRISPR type III-associated RAMP protein Csm4 [Bacillota bacterium]MBT9146866.1 CRISPR type III-associated RAMP protein Csm4 [Bacillota bacterium]